MVMGARHSYTSARCIGSCDTRGGAQVLRAMRKWLCLWLVEGRGFIGAETRVGSCDECAHVLSWAPRHEGLGSGCAAKGEARSDAASVAGRSSRKVS